MCSRTMQRMAVAAIVVSGAAACGGESKTADAALDRRPWRLDASCPWLPECVQFEPLDAGIADGRDSVGAQDSPRDAADRDAASDAALAVAIQKAAEPGNAPSRGNPKAHVTMVMFTDYQDPFCARVSVTIKDLAAGYPNDLRLVVKQYPAIFHKSATLAAAAALAAHEQGKFWDMQDRLYANQTQIDRASLEAHAQALGLDMAQFRAALDQHKFQQLVEDEALQARNAGLDGVPVFLVNGRKAYGSQPVTYFKNIVDEELARAGCNNTLDCDDNNPCTMDRCDVAAGCKHVASPAGTSCEGAYFCRDGEICDGAGMCSATTGTVHNCSDGNVCHTNMCDEAGNICTNTAVPNGTSCANATVCDGYETCQLGACTSGTALNCSDNNSCTEDTCNPATGACSHNSIPGCV